MIFDGRSRGRVDLMLREVDEDLLKAGSCHTEVEDERALTRLERVQEAEQGRQATNGL